MATFMALYRGESIADAELVAVSANSDLVGRFADEMLASRAPGAQASDPAVNAVESGRRRALEIVRDECRGE